MADTRRVLIVDDDAGLAEALSGLLAGAGYAVQAAASSEGALGIVRNEPVDLVLLDLRLGRESGLELLPQLRTLRPEMSVVMITAAGTIEAAVEAMRAGADNFVVKPVEPARLLALIAKGIESCELRSRNVRFERLASRLPPAVPAEPASRSDVFRQAEAVAQRDTTVLLCGETGTGKGVMARRLHEASPRARQPFVELDCAGLQRELTESELFGHEKGAFTGAGERKIGLLEAADKGTLFLDEVGELELPIQAKLLNVLERRRFRRVGGVAEIEVDVRLIAATNRNLPAEIAAGRFRQDLYYRLNVFTLELPPLRDRPEEVLPLALRFLREFQGPHGEASDMSEEAQALLEEYPWPGNIRELRNVMERAAILCPPETPVLPEHLPPLRADAWSPPAVSATAEGEPARSLRLRDSERQHLENVLRAHHGNMAATARELGISRATLYRKVRRYGIPVEQEG